MFSIRSITYQTYTDTTICRGKVCKNNKTFDFVHASTCLFAMSPHLLVKQVFTSSPIL